LGKICVTCLSSEAVSALNNLLKDKESGVKAAAAATLGKFHTQAAVQNLTDCLRDRSPAVRETAAKALGQLGEKISNGAVTSLVHKSLRDPSAGVRLQAAIALGQLNVCEQLGANADLVTQALTERLKDTDDKVRKAANLGLTKPKSVQQIRESQAARIKDSRCKPKGTGPLDLVDFSGVSWRRTENQMKVIRAAYSHPNHCHTSG